MESFYQLCHFLWIEHTLNIFIFLYLQVIYNTSCKVYIVKEMAPDHL